MEREDVLELLVPWCESHEALGAKLSAAQRLYFASETLTVAATRLVESLIDGTIQESEFAATQGALEAGNRDNERALLQALRRGDETAIFADLNALYALLDEDDTARAGH